MTEEQLREETRRLIAQEDRELAQDEGEVTRRMSKTLDDLLTDSNVEREHYTKVAEEASEEHKRTEYEGKAASAGDRARGLRALQSTRNAKGIA